jgi:hypothetical protein
MVEEEKITSIDLLIESQAWNEVERRLADFPDEASHPLRNGSPSRGWTRLHWLCSMGSTPGRIIELVASLHTEAVALPDKKYGDTPLHIACRNSFTTTDKVQGLLLHHRDPEAILIRNHFGGTALHSASNHNALLGVLQALVQANDRILRVPTFQGVHAVTTLWQAYAQTIPGHMCVARILQTGGCPSTPEESHFERFWDKCTFLATEYFRRSPSCPDHVTDKQQLQKYVLHGLIQSNVPIKLFQVALKRDPTYALVTDAHGNMPMHLLLESRPYRLKEKEAILTLLPVAPQAASHANHQRDVPLVIAIRNRIPWANGVEVLACPTVVERRDESSQLLPFQLAASIGGNVSVETTYHLLCMRPDLLGIARIEG